MACCRDEGAEGADRGELRVPGSEAFAVAPGHGPEMGARGLPAVRLWISHFASLNLRSSYVNWRKHPSGIVMMLVMAMSRQQV